MAGATRLAEGSVRARGEVETHTSPFALLGSLPHQQSLAGSLAGRPVKRRFEALDHTLAVPTAGGTAGGPFAPALRWLRRFGFAPEPLSVLDGPIRPQPGDSSIATRKPLLPGPALQPAQVEARASEYYGGEVSPTAGARLTFGRRYGARFILHLGEASYDTLTLFQMGGYIPF